MASKEILYKQKKFKISYQILNIDKMKTIVFLHGWGSNKEIMSQAFGKNFDNFKHIYIDMPGFGASSNDEILTTLDYKNIIEIFLQKLNLNIEMIFGHSFGGKVATLLNPNILVLLSSSGILEQKPLTVKIKILIFKFLKLFGGSKLFSFFVSDDVKGMSKNMYKTFKNVVDENFAESFKNFKNKAIILWGKNDKSTSLESGKKIASLIKNSSFKAYDGEHYFFLKKGKNIEFDILNLHLTPLKLKLHK